MELCYDEVLSSIDKKDIIDICEHYRTIANEARIAESVNFVYTILKRGIAYEDLASGTRAKKNLNLEDVSDEDIDLIESLLTYFLYVPRDLREKAIKTILYAISSLVVKYH